MAVLAANSFLAEPSLPLIFGVAALLAATSSLQRPSREALEPRTVRHDQITAANALSSFGMQVGVLVGPAIGGVLIAWVGIGWCFVVDVVALAVACALYAAMRPYPHRGETTPPSLRGIAEGLALRDRPARPARHLPRGHRRHAARDADRALPGPGRRGVRAGPRCSGCSTPRRPSAPSSRPRSSGWTSHVHHHGRAIVIAATAYGACIALAGLAPSFGVALVCFAMAGAADMISAVFRGTVWNQTIPEHMRGRLAGIEMLSYSVGPLGGQVRAGFVADAWSVRGSIVSGGVACVGGVLLTAALLRDFWSYDNRTDEHAVAERERRAAAAS